MILTAEDFYLPPTSLPIDAWERVPPAERVLAWVEATGGRRFRRAVDQAGAKQVNATRPLQARIDAGRWIVQCECNSAQVVSKMDRHFWCVECLNGDAGGDWRPVVFPPNVEQLEAAMMALPISERFWYPPVTVG